MKNASDGLLSPFECAECHSQKCKIEPVLPQFTETHEGGLYITCAECGEDIGCIAVTEASFAMLLEVEKMNLTDELNEGKN